MCFANLFAFYHIGGEVVSLLICKYSPFRSGRDAVVATQNEAELKEAPGPNGQYWIGQGGPQHNLPLPERLEKLDNISSNACRMSAKMEKCYLRLAFASNV